MTLRLDTSSVLSRQQQEAFIELLADEHLWTDNLNTSLRRIINFCARHLNVSRVGLWKLSDDQQLLRCEVLCDTNLCTLEPALEVSINDHPNYFKALLNQRVIVASHALADPLTASFSKSYLQPLNIGALLDATVRKNGKTIGIVCAEHTGSQRQWQTHEQHFITSIADLISQIEMRHAMLASEERYRKVFDSTADAIVLMQDINLVDCNESALKMLKCTREQFLSYPPHHYWAEYQADGQLSSKAIGQHVKPALAGTPQLYEWRHRRFTGEEFDTEVSLNCITLNDMPHVIVCLRDITERKQAQRKIQQLLTLQQAIFDGAAYSIISIDLAGVIKSFNQASEAMTGLTAESVIEQTNIAELFDPAELQWRAIELSEELNTTIEADHSAFTALPSRGSQEEREWTLIKGHECRIPVLVSVTALNSGDADFNGYLLIISDITERKRASEQLIRSQKLMEYRAHHDHLTGLPNRVKLHQTASATIKKARATNQMIALLLIDLDRFKEVNDTLGHVTGDKFLQKISMRLNHTVKSFGAQIYRLGGDEFAVLYPNPIDEDGVRSITRRVYACLRSPTHVDDITLELGGSIGISLYPNHGDNSHSLLRCADVAMYRAKSEATRTFIYEQEQDAHSPRRLTMMAELGSAIRENQLCLFYQPKIRLSDRQCVGSEALLRWHHPVMGLVPPTEFIPLAEMSDLIRPLGVWVLKTAIAQLADWKTMGIELTVAINLSTRNLMDAEFPKHVELLLQEYDVDPKQLEIEITESTLIGDPERALQIINRIHALGVRFAIDDFGTGYSSLGYLKRLPIETLKIDRSFIKDMLEDEQDRVIVHSTVGLAHSFGLKVVAEGVEDEQTLDALKSLSCEEAQGYLISRPVPADDFIQWLNQQPLD